MSKEYQSKAPENFAVGSSDIVEETGFAVAGGDRDLPEVVIFISQVDPPCTADEFMLTGGLREAVRRKLFPWLIFHPKNPIIKALEEEGGEM